MEQLTETIALDMEESNELAFKIKVEGASSPAKVRLVCESGDVAYMFNGRGTSDEGVVQFIIPQMKGKLQEGTYAARVEVLIENRYFSPVQFQLNFKKTVQVFAESLQLVQKVAKPEVKVTAVPVAVVQPKVEQRVVAPPPGVPPAPVQQVSHPAKTMGGTFTTLREKFLSKKIS
jgi:hypothetical protein